MIELLFCIVALFGDIVTVLLGFLAEVGAAAVGLVVFLLAALFVAGLIEGLIRG